MPENLAGDHAEDASRHHAREESALVPLGLEFDGIRADPSGVQGVDHVMRTGKP